MTRGRRTLRLLLIAPALVGATTACFATRNDVRLLQNDLKAFRAEQARRDSLMAIQATATTAALAASLAVLGDSVKVSSVRVARWQVNTNDDLRLMQEQLLSIQELVGQSQRRVQELRATLEERAGGGTVAGGAPTTPGDTTTRPAGSPGPNQLFLLAQDQLRRGSSGTARTGFEELLRLYPASELAPDAQFWIAESYAQEGKTAEADSGYMLVVTKYPKSTSAPTGLFKHALILERAGKAVEAKAAFERLIKEYPSSDEAGLAKDHIRGN